MTRFPGSRRRGAIVRTVLAASLTSCTGNDGVRIQLEAQPAATGDPRTLEVRAQVSGPPTGLRYHWFSVAGAFEPQVSESPSSAFRFAEGASRDRVAVEVWRGGERVAESALEVEIDELTVLRIAQERPAVQIEITTVPPYEPDGGDATRADIAGRVTGDVAPEYQVVIYARADAWYIQPHSHTFHPIGPGSTWSSWTHTGSSYAALLVRPGFDALTRLDVLPQVGGYVLARAIVEGARR